MTLIVRGIFWFGLYVFLVTFPLLAAVLAALRHVIGKAAQDS